MLDTTEYGYFEMPPLRQVLQEIAAESTFIRAHIYSGAPRHWYCRRQIRRVHANARYKNGKETFRSKNLTDEVLDMPVARTVVQVGRHSILIFVFKPYGHIKERVLERDPATGTERWTVAEPKDFQPLFNRRPMSFDQDEDDELPF